MKNFFLATVLFIFPFGVRAAGAIDFLEVDSDVVIFSTSEAKVAASPTCVATDNANLWTVSLASDSGRAIYSLILTSMAKDDGVALNIESAQDCADKTGIERASKVNLAIVAEVEQSSNQGSTIGFYAGDGVTRLGTVLQMGETQDSWYYAGPDDSTRIKFFSNPTSKFNSIRIFFKSDDCTGSDYVDDSYQGTYIRNNFYNEGKFHRVYSGESTYDFESFLDPTSGECVTSNYNDKDASYLYDPTDYTIEPCGMSACTVRVD